MTGTSKAQERLNAFYGERVSYDPPNAFSADTPALARLRALEEYRRSRARVAGFGPLPGPTDLNWSPIGPFAVRRGQAFSLPVVSGRVRGIGVSNDGQRVYIGSANGGVWRSTDGGREWEPTSDEQELAPTPSLQQVDSLACGALALVDRGSQAQDLLYVGTGEGNAFLGGPHTGFFGVGMLRSDDGGGHWTREDATPTLAGAGVFGVAVDPDDASHDHAVAVTTRGVFRRRSRVNPWQEEPLGALGTGNSCSGVAVGRTGADVVFYVTTAVGQVFSSRAGGAWTAMNNIPAPACSRVTLAASASTPTVLYALACTGNGLLQGLHRLNTGDVAPVWRTLTGVPTNLFGDPTSPPGQGNYDQALVVDPHNENLVYIGGSTIKVGEEYSGSVFRCRVVSIGAGAFDCDETMIGGSAHGDIHVLTFRPGSSTELWLGCDGGVFVAGDARVGTDRVFDARNTGLTTYTLMGLDHLPGEEAYAFCGVQDNGGIRWLGGDVWDHQLYGDGGASVVNHKTSRRLLSSYINTDVRRADIDGARYKYDYISVPATSALFYPPLVASPANGDIVFFGGDKLYVSRDFGSNWDTTLPAGPAGSTNVRSLVAASDTRVYVGWNSGRFARYDFAGGAWTMTNLTRPTENRAITGITLDPAKADGSAVYVCLAGFGGATTTHVWHLDTALPAATRWTASSGTAPNALLDIQHNAILADPGTPGRLWVGADLGVWVSDDSGANWRTLEGNLPDAAVVDLDLLRIPLTDGTTMQLLRASTHGRGVFELRLDKPQPRVELIIRANDLDQRRRKARAGVTLPGNLSATSVLDASPDIFVELPDAQGGFALRGDRPPIVTELVDLPPAAQILGSAPGSPAVTRVHVVVRNRGVTRVDDVRVTLLVGPKDQPLPATYADVAKTGVFAAADGWFSAGSVTLAGLRGSRPKVATFAVSSESLPPLSESEGNDYHLVALLHHTDDPFPGPTPVATTDPTTLVTESSHAAMRKVTVKAGQKRPAPPGGSGLLVPMSATLLTHQRLTAITTALGVKVATAGATCHPVERRVLAMAKAGLANLEAGPKPRVAATVTGANVGSYALLGSLGFQLPDYTGALLPGGGWVGQHLRRGTGDPHLSHVAVGASELPLQMARLGLAATSGTTKAAVQAFSTGMLAGAASNVLLSPQLADLYAKDTNADWDPSRASRGAAALEHHLRQSFLGGATGVTTLQSWLPPASDVPAALWEQYIAAIGQTYGLPGVRDHGFGSFEANFDAGFWLNPTRLSNGYGVLLEDVRSSSWSAWPWWGLLIPILIAPSMSLIAARSLPHAKAFFEGGELTERAYFETLTASMGIGAIAPFLYSMILWGKFDEHTEVFVTSLLMGLARGALVAAGLATADDEDQGAGVRWGGLFLPLVGADVYAALRGVFDSGRHPGNTKVMALQIIPAMTGLTTLGLAGLARAIGGGDTTRDKDKDDLTFWLLTLGSGALFLTAVGIPVALALSGNSPASWFLRDRSQLPLLAAVEHAGADPVRPTAAARVFEPGTRWPAAAPGAETDRQGYPAGTRPLVRVWYEGEGDLSVRYGADNVTFKQGAAETVVPLADPVTATSLAAVLQAGLAGVKAEVVGADEPPNTVPLPPGLADAGDEGALEVAETLRTSFVRVPTQKANAIVLREAPRTKRSTIAGNHPSAATPFPLLPEDPATDSRAGLGAAADLGALLVTAAAPSFATVTVADTLPALPAAAVGEVMQVFRRWNLNERRLEEWQSLVTGHGATAAVADPVRDGQNTLIRKQPAGYAAQATGRDVAEAMGWLPLWRAWLTVAGDTTADAGAAVIHAQTPTVKFPAGDRKPNNSELTEGVRFLLDMGAT